MWDYEKEFVQLLRFALEGKAAEIAAMARKRVGTIMESRPDLNGPAKNVLALVEAAPTRFQPTAPGLPVDADSRLELLRKEAVPALPVTPSWPLAVQTELDRIVLERANMLALSQAGVTPTRSVLFVGPPGVGKTLAAMWLATQVGVPLLTLDLAAVMSSFLGRTGTNLRSVLDYAQKSPSVLLLDEFDAIAKRRDDGGDVGELKRLVNVLLQAIDDWPADNLLIAATNHPELLDPAAWRRFERVVRFPTPSVEDLMIAIEQLAGEEPSDGRLSIHAVAMLMQGQSYADVARLFNRVKRNSIVEGVSFSDALLDELRRISKSAPIEARIALAAQLEKAGLSQRDISSFSSVARDTLRKHKRKAGMGERKASTKIKSAVKAKVAAKSKNSVKKGR